MVELYALTKIGLSRMLSKPRFYIALAISLFAGCGRSGNDSGTNSRNDTNVSTTDDGTVNGTNPSTGSNSAGNANPAAIS